MAIEHPGLKIRMIISGTILFGFYAAISLFLMAAFGSQIWPILAVGTLLFIGVQYKLGKWMAIKSVGAQDLPEDEFAEIHRSVERMSDEMDIKKPRLMIAEMGVPNAFAVGRKGAGTVVISAELIHLLDFDELEGVLAHELSHIKNRDVVLMVVGQSIATMVGYITLLIVALDEDLGFIAAWIISTIAQMIVMLFVLAISRHREYVADSDASKYVKGGGKPLADALRKIESAAKGKDSKTTDSVSALCIFGGERGLLASIFATHPPTEKRIQKLES